MRHTGVAECMLPRLRRGVIDIAGHRRYLSCSTDLSSRSAPALMARVLLVLFAVLAAGIGFVLREPLLYAAAGLLVVIAIGLWMRERMKERRRRERKAARAEAADDQNELRSLGIMEIRPRAKETEDEEAAADLPSSASDASAETAPGPSVQRSEEEGGVAASEDAAARTEEVPTEKGPAEETSSEEEEQQGDEAFEREEPAVPEPSIEEELPAGEAVGEGFAGVPQAVQPEDTPEQVGNRKALQALVRSVRLSTDARAVCLLAQEELALDYRIEACDAGAEAPLLQDAGTTFSTGAPLLTARASRQTVVHELVGEEELSPHLLGYYRQPEEAPPEVLALVPIPLPDDPTTHFLVLDGPRGSFERSDALLKRFASLFAEVIAQGARASVSSAASSASPPRARGTADEEASPSQNGRSASSGDASPDDEEGPRPRREIIAEEMEQARREGRDLALALVYLNRAESIAERGEEEVEAAERALRARLRQAASGERVARFGELTYGVFLERGSIEAERWAVALQEEMAQAADPLEGGVSVGLALMRGPEQTPEALRENATNALHEAYTTGTCTILE